MPFCNYVLNNRFTKFNIFVPKCINNIIYLKGLYDDNLMDGFKRKFEIFGVILLLFDIITIIKIKIIFCNIFLRLFYLYIYSIDGFFQKQGINSVCNLCQIMSIMRQNLQIFPILSQGSASFDFFFSPKFCFPSGISLRFKREFYEILLFSGGYTLSPRICETNF